MINSSIVLHTISCRGQLVSVFFVGNSSLVNVSLLASSVALTESQYMGITAQLLLPNSRMMNLTITDSVLVCGFPILLQVFDFEELHIIVAHSSLTAVNSLVFGSATNCVTLVLLTLRRSSLLINDVNTTPVLNSVHGSTAIMLGDAVLLNTSVTIPWRWGDVDGRIFHPKQRHSADLERCG